MNEETARVAGEVHLDPESVEAIARRLADLLGGGAEDERPRKQLLSAEEVSRWWGVSRRWVYDHAERLGARRLGTGSRPRLRFDPDDVAGQLGEPRGRPDTQRLPAISGDCGTNSLSPRTRAMVGRQSKKRPGRRTNAPRPGAEGGPPAQ
ncbi:MAG TPA: hypothetical protein VH275_04875 [Solirubrobacterales bacterium]|nr:hypothetical protein [Solirubrobacterales bacterium]